MRPPIFAVGSVSRLALGITVALLSALAACNCSSPLLPSPPPECDLEGNGCLPDEFCQEGKCLPFPSCDNDSECPSAAYRCSFPARVCTLRDGFGEECVTSTDCDPGNFCALGVCRNLEDARQCARRSDCPLGQACDRENFLCIEEGPCTLANDYPSLACDPGETCDPVSERCALECQNECTVETQEQDCGVGSVCDGACRCVQCISDDDCGPGLVCNVRAGRCESEDLCFSDDDCESPLVCDSTTALCQVPSPPCESDIDCAIAETCNRETGVCELPGGACIDDRFENADTPTTSELLRLEVGGDTQLIDDLQLCPDDDDVYAVNMQPGDQLLVHIFGTTPQARATVWLLDSEGETSVRFAEAPPFGNGTIQYAAQVEETVFIRVNALLGPTPYEMEVTLSAGAPCAPDVFEGDGNDTLETATPAGTVATGATYNLELCPSDKDFIAVHLLAGEGLEATLDFDASNADLDLAILDAATGAVIGNGAGLDAPERVRIRSPFERDVVVRVQGFGNDNGPYALGLERLPPFVCGADTAEPNDDVTTATVVTEDVFGEPHDLCPNEDDYYQVTLEDFERLVVHTQFAAEEIDMQIDILDATGEEVRKSSPNSAGGETVSYDAQGNETVLVRVQSRLNTSGPYTLDLFVENQAACEPDVFEPNDSVSAAAPAPDGLVSLSHCAGDEDLFVVEGVGGKQLRATATFLNADADLDVVILNFDGVSVLDASDGVGDQEVAEALLPLDGPYFVRVFSLDSEARARYDLRIEQVTP